VTGDNGRSDDGRAPTRGRIPAHPEGAFLAWRGGLVTLAALTVREWRVGRDDRRRACARPPAPATARGLRGDAGRGMIRR
jgi:hypothetical protein